MSGTDALDAVWEIYRIYKDNIKIVKRCIDVMDTAKTRGTIFIEATKDQSDSYLKTARNEIDDFIIFSMWAVFERQLFDLLQHENNRVFCSAQSKAITEKIFKKIEQEIEYWRIDEVLDIFKTKVDPSLIGEVKKVKKYRDWLAHRNPKKGTPAKVDPNTAYNLLRSVLSQL